jgi:hypothetical protein
MDSKMSMDLRRLNAEDAMVECLRTPGSEDAFLVLCRTLSTMVVVKHFDTLWDTLRRMRRVLGVDPHHPIVCDAIKSVAVQWAESAIAEGSYDLETLCKFRVSLGVPSSIPIADLEGHWDWCVSLDSDATSDFDRKIAPPGWAPFNGRAN